MEIDLPNLGSVSATEAVYDPASQQILFTNNGVVQSYSLGSNRVETHCLQLPTDHSPPTNPTNPLLGPYNNRHPKALYKKHHFQFRPAYFHSALHISASGLFITSASKGEQLAVSDVGFQSGAHFWEIICPKPTADISIGVHKEGWALSDPSLNDTFFEGNVFRTTTAHTVGVRLDLDKGELKYWIDGIFQPSKTRLLKHGVTYFAAVKCKESGSYFILNPFAMDPEDPLITMYENKPKIPISYIKEALQAWVIISGFSKTQRKNLSIKVFNYLVDFPSFAPLDYIFEEDSSILGLRFKSLEEAIIFTEKNSFIMIDGKPIFILDRSYLQQWAVELSKEVKSEQQIQNTVQINSIQKWFKRNFKTLIKNGSPLDKKELSTQAEHAKIIAQTLLARTSQDRKEYVIEESQANSSSTAQLRLEYNSLSKNIIIIKDNMIKLATRSTDLREYPFHNAIFKNRPNCPKDDILIPMSVEMLARLFSNMQLESKLNDASLRPFELKSIADFLKAVEAAISQAVDSAEILYLSAPYKTFKRVIDLLLSDLLAALNKNNRALDNAITLLETKALRQVKESANSGSLLKFEIIDSIASKENTQEELNSLFRKLPLNSLYNLINSLLLVDEALFAMIQHEDASPKFQSYWQNRNSRLFSAFSRLSSLSNFPSNKFSPIELAEAGVYNSKDILYDARHYLDPEKQLDAIQNLRSDQSLSSFLEKSLPDNRMIRGLPSTNVPLSATINNLPAQYHSRSGGDINNTQIIKLAQNSNSTHIVTASQNGDVKIWNTEVGLVNIGEGNFRTPFSTEGASIPSLGNNAVPNSSVGGFPAWNSPCFVPIGASGQTSPDPILYQTLLKMGFPSSLASNALVASNNAGFQPALETVLALQSQNMGAFQPSNFSVNIEPSKLKLQNEWTCGACTFINISDNKLCEICEHPPPFEAYEMKPKASPLGFKQPELTISSPENTLNETVPGNISNEILSEKETKRLSTTDADITDVILINARGNMFCPTLVGVIFNDGKNSLLRLRHFTYSLDYVYKYLAYALPNKIYSHLSNKWFGPPSLSSLNEQQNYLFNEFRLSFTALGPLFDERKVQKASSVSNQYLRAMKEFDVPLQYETVLSVMTGQSSVQGDKETIDLFVLGRNKNGIELAHYLLTIEIVIPSVDNNYPNHISCELLQKREARFITGNKAELIVTENQDIILLDCDSNSLHILPGGDTARVSSIQLSYKIKTFKIIDQKALLIIDSNNKFHALELKSGYFPAAKLNYEIQVSPEKIGKEFVVPQIKELTNDEIDSLHQTLYSRSQPAVMKTKGAIPLKFDRGSSSFSKFYLPLENNAKKVLEYEFVSESQLLSVNLELHFERGAIEEIQNQKEYYENLLKQIASEQPKTSEEVLSIGNQNGKQNSVLLIDELPVMNDAKSKCYLPLSMVTFKGGSYSDKYPVTRILVPNSDVFLSNHVGAEFVFQHLHEKTMVINSVTLHSDYFSQTNVGYPIGSGLIFTSNYLAHFDMTAPFNGVDHQEYQKWLQERKNLDHDFEPWEPVGCFQFDEKSEVVTVDLDCKRPTRYILLKPTSMRSKPESYSRFFKLSPIELKFLGVTGSVAECGPSDSNLQKTVAQARISLQGVCKCNLSVEVNTGSPSNPQWTEIYNNKDASLSVDQVHSSKITSYFIKNKQLFDPVAMTGSSSIEIVNELFSRCQIRSIRVTVSVENSSKLGQWKLNGVSSFATVSKRDNRSIKSQDEKPIQFVSLRTIQKDPEALGNFGQKLIGQLTDPSCSLVTRTKISKLLSELISQGPAFPETIYKQLDLCNYLTLNVLSQTSSYMSEVLSLLNQFLKVENFTRDLLSALLKLLPFLLKTKQITKNGLNGFFNLLIWCYRIDSEGVFLGVLAEIEKTIKSIRQLRPPEYNLLRTQYNISSMVLEKELFSTDNISKSFQKDKDPKKNQFTGNSNSQRPLPAKIFISTLPDNHEYLIDLNSLHRVSSIKLSFDKFTKSTHFKVQIWSISLDKGRSDKSLIYSQFYTKDIWIQLTNYAYDASNANYFSDTEELETLGFSNLNVIARYLIVQLSYTIFPQVASMLNEQYSEKVIPVVFGEKIEGVKGETLPLKDAEHCFEPAGLKPFESVVLPHSSKYDKYNLMYTTNCKVLDSTGTLKRSFSDVNSALCEPQAINVFDPQNIEANFSQLANLQAELVSLLNTSRNHQSFTENKPKIIDSCKRLEILQLDMLGMRNQGPFSKIEPAKSLDFLYTIAIKYSQLLRKIDSEVADSQLTWRGKDSLKKDKGAEIITEIFETTMIFENSQISTEFTQLLSQVLIPTLESSYTTEVVFRLVDNFLTMPISITLSPIESLFSHIRVIEGLGGFSIHSGEILSYLINKLGVPVNEGTNEQKLSKEISEQTALTILASGLLLLKKKLENDQISKRQASDGTGNETVEKETKQAIKLKDSKMEIIRFNYENSLKAAFYICGWISKNNGFNSFDKISILSLGIDVLLQLISLSKPSSVKNILESSETFLQLTMNTIQISSPVLLDKFKSFLNVLLNLKSSARTRLPKDDNISVPTNSIDEQNAAEIKVLLAQHLQKMLNSLTSFALKRETPKESVSFTKMIKDLSPNIWLQCICLILKFLITASESIAKQGESKSSKAKPQSEQKKSAEENKHEEMIPISKEDEHRNAESSISKFGTSAAIPFETVNSLILLLATGTASQEGFNLSNSIEAWNLSMKVIRKVETSYIFEAKMFDSLIKSFLQASDDIQQSLIPEILASTKNIAAQSQNKSETFNKILDVVLSTLKENERQHLERPMDYLLINGWLDILLTMQTPKPADYYTNMPHQPAFCILDAQGAQNLLQKLSSYLIEHLNLGGQDGVNSCSDVNVVRFQIANDLLLLLLTCENTSSSLSIAELFSNFKKFQDTISRDIYHLIEWYILNRTTEVGVSPATGLIKQVSDSILKLLTLATGYEEVVRAGLSSLIQICRQVDQSIMKLQSGQHISSYVALKYMDRACEVLKELFRIWMISDVIASHVVFEMNGFEYLLDRMGIFTAFSSSVCSGSVESKALGVGSVNKSLLAEMDIFEHFTVTKDSKLLPEIKLVDPSTTGSSNEAVIGNNENPKEEEFGSKLTLIDESGQTVIAAASNWAASKVGAKARMRLVSMQGPSYNEHYWIFNLGKMVELKQIMIGFNTVAPDHHELVLGVPSSVLIEGGSSLNDLAPLGVLIPINDEGYNNYSVKCLRRNFEIITRMGGNVNDSLSSLSNKRISCLKIRVRRPIITFIENSSLLSGRKYDHVAISVCFISIVGYDTAKLPNVREKLLEKQESSALQALGKLCNPNFSQTVTKLANKDTIVSKIKKSFAFLSGILVPNEYWLAPVFLAIAAHNNEMGDWIMNKLLDTSRSQEHTKLVSNIVACNNDLLYNRLEIMNSFILRELKKYVSLNTSDSLNKFNSLVNFIEAFCSCVRYLPLELVQQINEGKRKAPTLAFSSENIDDIITAFELFNTSTFNTSLIQMLLLYLYAPKPFITTEASPGEFIQYTLETLWTRCNNKPAYYQMIGPVIIGSKGAVKWFVQHLNNFLNGIISVIQSGNSTAFREIRQSLSLVHSLSCSKEIKKITADKKWHLVFYDSLKTDDPTSHSVLRKLEPDVLAQSVEVLKNLVIGYEPTEVEMAARLKEDLRLLQNKRDMFYVNNLLIPLLNAESTLPVCLHLYNSQTNQWITGDKKLRSTQSHDDGDDVQKQIVLNSKILEINQRAQFFKTLKAFTKQTELGKKLSQLDWQLCFTCEQDKENNMDKISKLMSNKGPFLIIVEGMHQEKLKPCVIGIFSSQSMPQLPNEDAISKDTTLIIPLASDSFYFYYEEDITFHFTIPPTSNGTNDCLGVLDLYPEGGGDISFYHSGIRRILLSHSHMSNSYVDIHFPQMKPLEVEKLNPADDAYCRFQPTSFEYWLLKPKATQAQSLVSKKAIGSSAVQYPAWHVLNHPLGFYRVNPVYSVPTSINMSKMTKIMLGSETSIKFKQTHEQLLPKTGILDLYSFIENDPSANNIIDLEYNILDSIVEPSQKSQGLEGIDRGSTEERELKYLPAMTIYTAFEKDHGVESLIDATIKSLSHWKDKEKSKRWLAWVQELASFSQLPNYFGLFLKNRQCIDLLFQILAGIPDEPMNTKTNWEDEEQKAVKFSYQILAEIFRVDIDVKVREIAIEKQFLDRIFDRIEIVSKEFKRKWTHKIKEEEEEKDSPAVSPATKGSTVEEEDENGRKRLKKKKGIGYASGNLGQNQIWDSKVYVQNKKMTNDQLVNLLEIIQNFLDTKDWTPPKTVFSTICGSALLPLLESAFRSGSLLDMGKESELYSSYLKLTRTISQHKTLIPALLELDAHYQPKQKDSVFNLLKALKDTAQIFLNCLTTKTEKISPEAKLPQTKSSKLKTPIQQPGAAFGSYDFQPISSFGNEQSLAWNTPSPFPGPGFNFGGSTSFGTSSFGGPTSFGGFSQVPANSTISTSIKKKSVAKKKPSVSALATKGVTTVSTKKTSSFSNTTAPKGFSIPPSFGGFNNTAAPFGKGDFEPSPSMNVGFGASSFGGPGDFGSFPSASGGFAPSSFGGTGSFGSTSSTGFGELKKVKVDFGPTSKTELSDLASATEAFLNQLAAQNQQLNFSGANVQLSQQFDSPITLSDQSLQKLESSLVLKGVDKPTLEPLESEQDLLKPLANETQSDFGVAKTLDSTVPTNQLSQSATIVLTSAGPNQEADTFLLGVPKLELAEKTSNQYDLPNNAELDNKNYEESSQLNPDDKLNLFDKQIPNISKGNQDKAEAHKTKLEQSKEIPTLEAGTTSVSKQSEEQKKQATEGLSLEDSKKSSQDVGLSLLGSNKQQLPPGTGFNFQTSQQKMESVPGFGGEMTTTMGHTSGFSFGSVPQQQLKQTGFNFGGFIQSQQKQAATNFGFGTTVQQNPQNSGLGFGSFSSNQNDFPSPTGFSFGTVPQQQLQSTGGTAGGPWPQKLKPQQLPISGFSFGSVPKPEINQPPLSFGNTQTLQQSTSTTSFSFGGVAKPEQKQFSSSFTNVQPLQQQQGFIPSFSFGGVTQQPSTTGFTPISTFKLSSSPEAQPAQKSGFKFGETIKLEGSHPQTNTMASIQKQNMTQSYPFSNSSSIEQPQTTGFNFEAGTCAKPQGFSPMPLDQKPTDFTFGSSVVKTQPSGFSFQPNPPGFEPVKNLLNTNTKKSPSTTNAKISTSTGFATQNQMGNQFGGGGSFVFTKPGFSFGGTPASNFGQSASSMPGFGGFGGSFQPMAQPASFGQPLPSSSFSFGQSPPTFYFGSANPSNLQASKAKPLNEKIPQKKAASKSLQKKKTSKLPKKTKKKTSLAEKKSELNSSSGLNLPKKGSFSNVGSLGSNGGPTFEALSSGGGFTFNFANKKPEEKNKDDSPEEKEKIEDLSLKLQASNKNESKSQPEQKESKPVQKSLETSFVGSGSLDSDIDEGADEDREEDDSEEKDEVEKDEVEKEDEEKGEENLDESFESPDSDYFPIYNPTQFEASGFSAAGGVNINPPEKLPFSPPNDSDFEKDSKQTLDQLFNATKKCATMGSNLSKLEDKEEIKEGNNDDGKSAKAKEPEISLFDPYGNVLPVQLPQYILEDQLAPSSQPQFSFPQPTTGFSGFGTGQGWSPPSKKTPTTTVKESDDTNSFQINQKLAQEIVQTYNFVEEAIAALSEDDDDADIVNYTDILSKDLPIKYKFLLKDLRFDYTDMKDTNRNFIHHYSSYIVPFSIPPQTKMVRLAQELADLSNALPMEHTNSIFVRVDESRVDVMKALIMGSAGTPYGHGAFEYDIYLDDSYPNAPPKVNLTTTGSGRVRFNPNLYSCGKVCLSLLGTWRGNATENWDPKLSTMLQVLVSIQAIIMSEEVYFNEPGFEGELGTVEGEKKNEAYANIVRYCNIKFAMIDQIRSPPKGFETVIRRHFYLKKDEILEEVRKWIKYAEVREASYVGLVNDHNYQWCSEFSKSKHAYRDMLAQGVRELEDELNRLPPPSVKDMEKKFKKQRKVKDQNTKKGESITTGVANLDEIDVTYEKDVKYKELSVDDAKVKDRWSRYIGAMGMDAVAKQAHATVFLSGIGALGVEIAKNIVLSGVKQLIVHDDKKTTYRDLSGQFFLSQADVGKNRVIASLDKIQQLNYYVKVTPALLDQKLSTERDQIETLIKGCTVVILTECDLAVQVAFDSYCRENGIYFISTDCFGPFSRVFTDFGSKFTVLDKNGEEVQEVMIKNITSAEEGVVTLLDGVKHKFEDGDTIIITKIDGMEVVDKEKPIEITSEKGEKTTTNSINGTLHKVQTINVNSFKIGDTRGFTRYIRNGLAKQIKMPIDLTFRSLEESLNHKEVLLESNMAMSDFLKVTHPQILHIAFAALDEFKKIKSRYPNSWDVVDAEEFIKFAEGKAKKLQTYKREEDKKYLRLMKIFSFTNQGVFAPLAALMGGFVAQESIKAITQKFMPTKQFFYYDCSEIIPELPEDLSKLEEAIKGLGINEKMHRSDGLRVICGEKLLREISGANVFMVGAGAIGCELLKNFAMIGLGTGEKGSNSSEGRITLTDPDVIENSNLNRQFLFREKHLRKSKSQTAAAAAIQMNIELKGHIVARLDKVHEGTANIFTNKFFEELTVVANALDNVHARRYVDSRCVSAKTPLLESGTLGPKGHVQVIIPHKTETYGSQQDPQEEGEIPHCTLKMFPEETLHCVEWARDKFGKIYSQRPKGLMKILDEIDEFSPSDSQEIKTLREAVSLLKKRPVNFEDCIKYARQKFQKYFVNDIRQLLYTYPIDSKTKEGNPFWSLPKRPPTEIIFSPKNLLHAHFVSACACLRANIFNIPIPSDARTNEGRLKIAEDASKVEVADFIPSDDKAKEISSQVDKEAKKVEEEENKDGFLGLQDSNAMTVLLNELRKLSASLPKTKEGKMLCCLHEEFEKDNDENFHIDLIYAMANCRSSNYKLEPMEWITVKLKAGKIIPALATTTACIAGLQTIELVKLIKKCNLMEMKNAFMSLAVPVLQLSEPGAPAKMKLSEKLEVTVWDRWEVKMSKNATLKELFEEIERTFELKPRDVNQGSDSIYIHAILEAHGKEKQREDILNSKLIDLLSFEEEEKYVDLNILMSPLKGGDILRGVPIVRIMFTD